MKLNVATSEDMEALGQRLGALARAGDIFVLTGELGAGKTTFTRGVGEALRVDTPVSSPTFVVARDHASLDPAKPSLVHIDAYRVGSAAEFDELDIDASRSVLVAEWAAPYADVWCLGWVELVFERPTGEGDDFVSDQPRTIRITGHGDCGDLMRRIADSEAGDDVSGD